MTCAASRATATPQSTHYQSCESSHEPTCQKRRGSFPSPGPTGGTSAPPHHRELLRWLIAGAISHHPCPTMVIHHPSSLPKRWTLASSKEFPLSFNCRRTAESYCATRLWSSYYRIFKNLQKSSCLLFKFSRLPWAGWLRIHTAWCKLFQACEPW